MKKTSQWRGRLLRAGLWLIAICYLPIAAEGQGVLTQLPPITNSQGQPIAGVTVSVFQASGPANALVCGAPVSVFKDAALSQAISPLVTDGFGNFPFYISPGLSPYGYTVSGQNTNSTICYGFNAVTPVGSSPTFNTITTTSGPNTFGGNVVLGANTINKVTITQPATGSTLTIADGKTLTANNSITLAGVDGKTLTANNSLTLAGTDGTTQTFQASDTIVGRATTDNLSNKTLVSPTSTGTDSGTETLTNKTLPSPVINGTPTGTGIPTVTLKKGTGAGDYTSALTTYVVVDSTNLCQTVTIPTGWKFKVDVSVGITSQTAAVAVLLALTDNAACSTANAGILTERSILPAAFGSTEVGALTYAINGDGASHNVALQFKTTNGADSVLIGNSTATGAPTMTTLLTPSN